MFFQHAVRRNKEFGHAHELKLQAGHVFSAIVLEITRALAEGDGKAAAEALARLSLALGGVHGSADIIAGLIDAVHRLEDGQTIRPLPDVINPFKRGPQTLPRRGFRPRG